MKFDDAQLAAIQAAVSLPFVIITGGAGTGKTTIIKEICTQAKAAGETPHLCAFAGKAAARLRQATGFSTSTIHRLLQYNGSGFLAPPFDEDSVVILDEASMVSSDLFFELISRNPSRLVLVGDPAQLPPVGKGQPFHDLINVRPQTVYRLEKCYRASEAVYASALQIRAGEIPPLCTVSGSERWDFVPARDAEAAQSEILKWVKGGHVDFDTDIILSPRNGDSNVQPATVRGMNTAIIEHFDGPGAPPREHDIMTGDRIINTLNQPDLDIWNGTTGEVHSVDIDGNVWFRVDVPVIDWKKTTDNDNPVFTELVMVPKKQVKHLQPAYCLSVHKSQGSQYRLVIFIALHRDSFALLDRSLIYTAVTRTKQHCVIVGQHDAFRAGIQKISEKRTVIQELSA